MIITDKTSSIFLSEMAVLVNPVNCVGIMGKGLALKFKEKYPTNFSIYQTLCNNSVLQLGKVMIPILEFDGKIIINFPTKNNFTDKSKISDIIDGLIDLKRMLNTFKIKSVAIPALGCGLGGLNYSIVRRCINDVFINSDIDVEVYKPQE